MSTQVEFYQKQAQANLSTIPWLAHLQEQALAKFGISGFPTRHDEEWKYTALDYLLRQNYVQEPKTQQALKPIHSDLPFAAQIRIENGIIHVQEQLLAQLPKGVLILPLNEALVNHASLVQDYLDKVLKLEHGFQYLNSAMMQLGVFIYIPAGVTIDAPIVVSHFQDVPNQAVYLRNLFVAEEGSHVTVLEEYAGDESIYLTNTITEIVVGKHAQLTHYKVQREGKAACHIGHVAVRQLAHSEFRSHSFSFGGALVRSDLSINLQEEYARCLMNGIYIPEQGQHVDHHTTVHHLVPHCTSKQDYKGILHGQSRAVFNGKVIVAKDAQHTDASQSNKNLLLSANAEIDTKPQLEIFADDVVCSHGATVGQLDEEALFYLATRGIDRVTASRYLVHAFAADNIRLITDTKLAEWLGNLIVQEVE